MKENKETIDILQEAVVEIQQLRRINEILEAKVSTMNLFAVAMGMKNGEGGMHPDPLWRLEKHLAELKAVDKVTTRLSWEVTCDGGLRVSSLFHEAGEFNG